MILDLSDPAPWTWAKLAALGDEARAELVASYGDRGKLALLIAARAHPRKPILSPFPSQVVLPCRGWACRGCPMEGTEETRCWDAYTCGVATLDAYAELVANEGLLPRAPIEAPDTAGAL